MALPPTGTRRPERAASDRLTSGDSGRLVGVSSLGPASIAKEAKLGQLMLERGLSPDPQVLADPKQKLKALLRCSI